MSRSRPFISILSCSLVALLTSVQASAQDPIWSPDVANIIYTHCSSCHHAGGIGPFPLMSYSNAVAASSLMPAAVSTRHMPPWPADPDYRHFANENVLTQGEIDAVVQWVNNGLPLGDISLEPDPPTFGPTGSLLGQVDLTVAIDPYALQTNTDEYRWFVIPNNTGSTVFINKMEVLPGLEDIVHHCDISYDLSGNSLALDQQDPLSGFNSSTGSPSISHYMNAWQPGGDVIRYPNGWGIEVPAGADFVVEIHYGPGGIGRTDSTLINIEFATTSTVRPITVGWTLGQNAPTLVDGPFFLPANAISTFHQEFVVPSTRSYLAICPHMHLLGKSYKVWYETPMGDSIPLIDIPQWDFHWQRYYYFQTIEVIPAGSVIKSEGVYDNTLANPYNPTFPPQDVGLGLTTEDEMFLCYLIWTDYQPGDEDIVIDSTLLVGVEAISTPNSWLLSPNLTSDHFHVQFGEPLAQATYITVLDVLGREVTNTELIPAGAMVSNSLDIRSLKAGQYMVELRSLSERWSQRLYKQ